LQREGQELYIVDLDSSNGVTVNGTRITPHVRTPVRPNDKIKIANVILECVPAQPQASAETTTPPPGSAPPPPQPMGVTPPTQPMQPAPTEQARRKPLSEEKTVTYDEDKHGR
jgi:pSer/pThr/pTyr-binding forkhead associated (FHA) protein